MKEKWDTHHHINPDFYVKALERSGFNKVWGLDQPSWSVKEQLNMMDKFNISRSIMSISTPGVHFGNGKSALELSTRCNDYMAEIIHKNPDRLGGFASVPLPDGESAAKELIRAMDDLSLDGICLMSNVNGKYIGSREYASFWKEADKRNAIIFIHPTTPLDKKDHIHLNFLYHFKCETSHALIDFFRNGLHREYPNVRFILSHGGGVLPSIFPMLIKELVKENPHAEEEWNKFRSRIYLDLALSGYGEMIPSIINFAGMDNILYGSDWCWAKKSFAYTIKLIENYPFEENEMQGIFLNNAVRLFESKENKKDSRTIKQKIHSIPDKLNAIPHSHILPEDVNNQLKEVFPEIDEGLYGDKHSKDSFKQKSKDSTPVFLIPDLSGLWENKKEEIPLILRTYNRALYDSREIDRSKTMILGSIDSEDRDQALSEIGYCLNFLKMDGICLFIDINNTKRRDFISDDILEKLAEYETPVFLHPKKSEGISLLNGGHSDSVYFIAKMFYLGKSTYINRINFILGHSFHLNRFLAQSINILYYFQIKKQYLFKYLIDWLITKDEKGLKYLKQVTISD